MGPDLSHRRIGRKWLPLRKLPPTTAKSLATAAQQEGADGELPRFDLMLLSLGPDTHVASLFPGRGEVTVANTPVMAVNDFKPPPTRGTMSLPAINSADRVWLLVAGSAKAEALPPSAIPKPLHSPPPAAPSAEPRRRFCW